MTTPSLPERSYSELLNSIKEEIAQGIDKAQNAYDREKIITYWKIGQAIAKHLSLNIKEADYGKQLYSRLSRDLGLGERLLYQISQFYSTYPDFKHSLNMNWTHYRLLASIKDEEQRNILEAKVSIDSLSARALELFLKEDRDITIPRPPEPKPKPQRKLTSYKGKLYTYKIFKAAYADNLLIDCGFSIYHESEVATFKGNYIETVKTESDYKFVQSSAVAKDLYTYKAYIENIVDGDTLWIIVDCGFKVWSRQKIRLRGINAPEISTPKGTEAMQFITNALKGLPFVVVKSHGRDKYDRYLMDIFYLKDATDPKDVLEKGSFLNQELLDKCLAVREKD